MKKTKSRLKGTLSEMVMLLAASKGISSYYVKEWSDIGMKLLKLELKCKKKMMEEFVNEVKN
jgi:hypothetical protein